MVDTLYVDDEFGTHIDKQGKRTNPIRKEKPIDQRLKDDAEFAEAIADRLEHPRPSLGDSIRRAMDPNSDIRSKKSQKLTWFETLRVKLASSFIPVGFEIVDTKPLRELDKFREEVVRLWSQYLPTGDTNKPMLLRLTVEEAETTEDS